MTFYESNRDVRPTGEEVGEFIDPHLDADERDGEDGEADPTARPTGSPPVRRPTDEPASSAWGKTAPGDAGSSSPRPTYR